MKISFLTEYPEIACQWHPNRNGNLHPKNVFCGSVKKVWWKCNKADDHEWQAVVRDRVRGNGCPYCSNRKIAASNCLRATHSKLVEEWYENGDITPDTVVGGSNRKVWWQCAQKHIWQASIKHRTHGSGCPFCANKRVSDKNSLAVSNPDIAKQWDYELNDSAPNDYLKGSHFIAWWKCEKGHKWKTSIKHRVFSKTNCPYCGRFKVDENNSLAITHPSIACEWHIKKNGNLTPFEVLAGSKKKVWWICKTNNQHEWQATINSRTSLLTKCPCCCNRKLSSDNSLIARFPEIAKEWNYAKNKNLTPENVISTSTVRVWWKCYQADDHEWQATVKNRVKGSKCPCCMNRKLVKSNSLLNTHYDLSKEWCYKKNKIKPNELTASSGRKVFWKCKKNHLYQAKVNSRIKYGIGCPVCQESHGENKINMFLKQKKIRFKRWFRFKTCKNKRPLPFDFVIFKNKKAIAAIEFQGKQHFLPCSFGSKKITGQENLKKIQFNDELKVKWCKNNKISLLVLCYKSFDRIEKIVEEFLEAKL